MLAFNTVLTKLDVALSETQFCVSKLVVTEVAVNRSHLLTEAFGA